MNPHIRPVEFLSGDPVLLASRNAHGFPYSAILAFGVIDASPQYERLGQALSQPDDGQREVDLGEIRMWLLAQPGVYASTADVPERL